jgi:hypothetical protein
MTDECKHCARENCPIFNYKCFGCRERALLYEPCKVLREQMALNMWRYGDVPIWKREPNCGCKYICKRKDLTKKEL